MRGGNNDSGWVYVEANDFKTLKSMTTSLYVLHFLKSCKR